MASWQWFGNLHTRIYRATGGRLGGNLAGLDMLLLTTTGRKSGLPRTTPMPFYRDGDALVIVGSNGGQPRNPAWLANLRARPEADVDVRGRRLRMTARVATPDERARLWPELKRWNKSYARYERKTAREIPVVFLEPVRTS